VDIEKGKRKKAVETALASLRLEGLDPGDFGRSLAEKFINGEMTTEEMGLEIDKYVKGLSENN